MAVPVADERRGDFRSIGDFGFQPLQVGKYRHGPLVRWVILPRRTLAALVLLRHRVTAGI
mgnify:CR=1 FL=1